MVDYSININVWQLFVVLLTTSLLQEIIIKPSVDVVKTYIKRCRERLEEIK